MKVRILVGAALGLAQLSSPSAFGAAADYAFQPVAVDVKNGPASDIAVRLVHTPSGKPVAGAVIFRSRLDMSPDGMGEMTAKLVGISGAEPGIYRFKSDFTMAGRWALKLQAKVPGEAETIEGTVVFEAK